ncbi:hypothetical protein [Quatrionicoccus australiensis]|uniref:hypothetical protein n=1 Tax=Quatrionicoccus australiensis TaxID=138118 RepID=UPI001CFA9118|nr:hypothetical protein [Quatrionicoccus australiensis]MCB4359410.1 hypothetical protein [Quatrionicoccus australiensis]
MLFLLTAGATATAGLAVMRLTTTEIAGVFIAGNTITGRKLDFQLDDFIPLLVRPIPLGNGQKLTQTTTVIVNWRSGRRNYGRIFWV